jgi:hypothetical protein
MSNYYQFALAASVGLSAKSKAAKTWLFGSLDLVFRERESAFDQGDRPAEFAMEVVRF